MDPGVFTFFATIAGYGLAVLLVILFAPDQRQHKEGELESLLPAFKTAARRMGFQMARVRKARGMRMEGVIDGSRVVAQCIARGTGPWLTTITVQPQPPLPNDVWLQSHWRSRASLAGDALGSSEPAIDTGDPTFDALVAVGGRTATARVLLCAPARHALLALARSGSVRLRQGEFVHETIERIWNAGQLIALVRSTLAAPKAFLPVSNVPAALADAARDDPAPGVRARCLATLLSEAPDHPRTSPALDAALADSSDAVRVVAATALGERGLPVLREIAAHADGDEEPAARAIAVLGRQLPLDEALAILDSALSQKRNVIAAAAIEALARTGGAAGAEHLQSVLRGEDEGLASIAASALGEAPPSLSEPVLLAALATPSGVVRNAIVRALAKVGDVGTIARLCALIEGGECHSSLVPIVQQAIVAIQARLPGLAPGQVSLAEGEAGKLALVEDAASGRVSIVEH
jgi:hypothetical protein